MNELTVREHMTLMLADTDLRGVSWLTREGTIRDTFSEPASHYYARLDRLIDEPAAVACYPVLCARLRRLREARAVARSSKRAG